METWLANARRRLRPGVVTSVAAALGVWLAATGEKPDGVVFIAVVLIVCGGITLAIPEGRPKEEPAAAYAMVGPWFVWFAVPALVVSVARLLAGY